MNWLTALARAIFPCIHMYQVVSTMHDDDEHPTATTVVRVCDVCGDLRSDTINGPASNVHTHKWKTVKRIRIIREGGKPDSIPIRHDTELQCEGCGDIKTVRGSLG